MNILGDMGSPWAAWWFSSGIRCVTWKEGIERMLPHSSNCFDSWNFIMMFKKKKKGICTYKVNVTATRIPEFHMHISIWANFEYVNILSNFKSCRIAASTNRTYSHHKIFKIWLMSHAFWFKYSLSDIVDLLKTEMFSELRY